MATHVRRNVYHMDWAGPQFAAFREGVRVMMTRAEDDPTSWKYQAAIHGILGGPVHPLHQTCTHHTFYFFPWHRAYLYYFERILRAAAGVATLALPYWNYSILGQAALPQPFRLPADATNKLYVAGRSMTGTSEVDSFTANYMDDLAEPVFTSTMSGSSVIHRGFGGARRATPDHFLSQSFGGTLETGVHDGVHGAVGGWMNNVEQSANDPIFWLHHANIDRLWNRWIEMGAGRLNETDAAWLDTTYHFFDETKVQRPIRARDVLSTIQLGYRYDDDPCPWRIIPFRPVRPFIPLIDICRRFPALCGAMREPGPGPIPPEQSIILARTTAPLTLGLVPVALPFVFEGKRLEELRAALALNEDSPQLDLELDVVSPRPGEIIRLEVQRGLGGAREGSNWVGMGQVAFFVPTEHATELNTAVMTITQRLHSVLETAVAGGENLQWRLRRVSGRQTMGGAEIPPAPGTVEVREVRLTLKPAGHSPPGGKR